MFSPDPTDHILKPDPDPTKTTGSTTLIRTVLTKEQRCSNTSMPKSLKDTRGK